METVVFGNPVHTIPAGESDERGTRMLIGGFAKDTVEVTLFVY